LDFLVGEEHKIPAARTSGVSGIFCVGLHTSRCVLKARSNLEEIELAKKAKKAVRRAWTKDDVRQLKSLAKQKAGVKKIAKALKRTPAATAVKAHTLGVSLDTRI
jgi:hypothetical protein